jgi:phosphoribosylformylglycinamidine synthase subunit PurL
LVSAIHDISDGGLLVSLAEMCLAGNIGALIDDDYDYETDFLFGESQGAYIISLNEQHYARVVDLAESCDIGAYPLGIVEGQSLGFNDCGNRGFSIPLATLRTAHEGFFPALMGKTT